MGEITGPSPARPWAARRRGGRARTELTIRRQEAESEHKQLSSGKPSEQQRITSQLAGIEGRLSATTAKFDDIEANLATALDLARDCHAAYPAADPQLRRLFNQAFITHLYIDDEGTHAEGMAPSGQSW